MIRRQENYFALDATSAAAAATATMLRVLPYTTDGTALFVEAAEAHDTLPMMLVSSPAISARHD